MVITSIIVIIKEEAFAFGAVGASGAATVVKWQFEDDDDNAMKTWRGSGSNTLELPQTEGDRDGTAAGRKEERKEGWEIGEEHLLKQFNVGHQQTDERMRGQKWYYYNTATANNDRYGHHPVWNGMGRHRS